VTTDNVPWWCGFPGCKITGLNCGNPVLHGPCKEGDQKQERTQKLRKLIYDQINCGCCIPEPRAIEEVAQYLEFMYGDMTLEELGTERNTTIMAELYYMICFIRGIQIHSIKPKET
jgi:hypothetical protein